MIFQLDNSLVQFAAEGRDNLEIVVSVLELLSVAQREGSHLVFAELDVADGLIGMLEGRDGSARSLLLKVINQYPRIGSLAYGVKLKALIGDFELPQVSVVEGVRRIEYPLGLVNSNLLQKSLILVENLTDADFYRWITNAVLIDTNFSGVSLALEGYPGGGNTTAEAYDNLKANTSRLCLCIVDSDIRAPLLGPGETAKKVIKSDLIAPVVRANYHVIGACSIENLIPFYFFEQAWRDDPNYSEKLEVYRAHYREGHWKYLQLKKNISCFELYGGSAFSVYWSSELAAVEVGCVVDRPSCGRKSSCNEYKLPLLSGSPLGAALPLIKAAVIERQQLLPDIRVAWENIAEEILGWCCASTAHTATA
ncbi:hypothetical protein [Pseudomonas sp. Xaverov 83]|uniref:hypothetical protein n=1 Tax=Pseudomonas sp. Xaverov 83 TaxID=2666087 RepID=UPI001C5BEB18|nr:hypothetical protein [Pseudomonas sp. Xaverov 83]